MLMLLTYIMCDDLYLAGNDLITFTDENYDDYKDKIVFFTTKICETCEKIIPALKHFAK